MNLEKFNALSKEQMKEVTGGRRVEKHDIDGDGKWDIKIVYDKYDNVKRIVYRR